MRKQRGPLSTERRFRDHGFSSTITESAEQSQLSETGVERGGSAVRSAGSSSQRARARARGHAGASMSVMVIVRCGRRGRAGEKQTPNGRVPPRTDAPATAHWHASADACLPGFRTDRIRHHARARHRRTTVTGRRPHTRPSSVRAVRQTLSPRTKSRTSTCRPDQPGTAQRTTVLHDTELGAPLYGPVSRLSSALGYRKSGPSAFPPWPCSHRRAQHTVPRAHK